MEAYHCPVEEPMFSNGPLGKRVFVREFYDQIEQKAKEDGKTFEQTADELWQRWEEDQIGIHPQDGRPCT